MRRTALALLACSIVAACALPPRPAEPPPLGPGEVRSVHAARDALTLGASTKAAVRAALGEATVIGFDSGYEVWVYREPRKEKQPPPAPELVLLFPPSGVLAKARVR